MKSIWADVLIHVYHKSKSRFEIIFVDDNSTDNSLEKVKRYKKN